MNETQKFGVRPITVTQSASDFDPETLRLMAVQLEGTEAACNGSPRDANPYTVDSAEGDAWLKSFDKTSSAMASRQ